MQNQLTQQWTKRMPTANIGFALWGLTCFVQTFVQHSKSVLRMDSSAKNPPQRKAANRCRQPITQFVSNSWWDKIHNR
jgi:hypothetical protein